MTACERAATTFEDLCKTDGARQDNFAARRVPGGATHVERLARYASGLFWALR